MRCPDHDRQFTRLAAVRSAAMLACLVACVALQAPNASSALAQAKAAETKVAAPAASNAAESPTSWFARQWNMLTGLFSSGSERGRAPTVASPANAPPPQVTVSRPVVREITEWDEYTGRFDAVETIDVRARLAGYLNDVHFKDGQMVQKGDLLFTIDPRPFERALDTARAEFVAARTKVENTMKDVERGRPLLDRRIISEKVFDDRENVKRDAEAAVSVAEAKVKTAELDLSFTRITSPITGRISRNLVSAGNYIIGGAGGTQTLLTTIVSQDPMHFYFDVSENNTIKYKRLATDGSVKLGEAGAPVDIAIADDTGFPHAGRLDFTDNRLDQTTGTLRLRALVDNKTGLFSAGMFGRVRIAGSAKYQAVMLPDDAIGTDQANKFVTVVAEDGSATRRAVTLGPIVGGMRVIRSGLGAEDWAIIKGLQRARPGQKVNPKREPLQVSGVLTDAPPATVRQ